MKIQISKDNLLYGVQTVQRAVSAKAPIPVLTGIRFQATANSQLVLMATDNEIGIGCNVPITTVEEGAVVIPAKYITEIARKLPNDTVELSTEGDAVLIKYGKSQAKLGCFPAEQFPQFPPVKSEVKFDLPVKEFKEMLKQVEIATSDDDNRPVFTGVFLKTNKKSITMVATDTHRLAQRDVKLDNSLPSARCIIPGRTLNDLVRIMGDDEFVKVVIGEQQVSFALHDTVMFSRLIDGKFPDYKQILPKEYKTKIKFKVKDFVEATERAALMTKGGSNKVLKYKLNRGLMPMVSLSANTEIGAIHEEILLSELNGEEEMQIAFSADYIIDALKTIGSEEAYLELTGPLSPGVLKRADTDDYLHLVLPVRIA